MVEKPGPEDRVLIGLTAVPDSSLSIDIAVCLASALNADIVGLFVEESALVDFAGLPFACVLSTGGNRIDAITRESMAQVLARTAQKCREVLSARAARSRLNWSFSTQKGVFSHSIVSAAKGRDYLVIDSDDLSREKTVVVEKLRDEKKSVQGVVLTPAREPRSASGPVVVIDDGDAAGLRSLEIAVRLADVRKTSLVLVAVAENDDAARQIRARAEKIAGGDVALDHVTLTPGSAGSLENDLSRINPGFVVGDLSGEPFTSTDSILKLVRSIRAPLLLLKGG